MNAINQRERNCLCTVTSTLKTIIRTPDVHENFQIKAESKVRLVGRHNTTTTPASIGIR
jgi:hypothetical protein